MEARKFFFLRERGDFDPARGRAGGAAPSQYTSKQTDNQQSRMDPNSPLIRARRTYACVYTCGCCVHSLLLDLRHMCI